MACFDCEPWSTAYLPASSQVLLKLLHGRLELPKSSGNLLCPLRTALVGPQPQPLAATSLHDNLLGNLSEPVKSDRLWELCSNIGK